MASKRQTAWSVGHNVASRRSRTVATKAALLGSLPGYDHLAARELDRLATHFDDIRVGAGTVLARQGRPSQELCLIVEGEATLSARGEPIGTLGPADVVGEPTILGPEPHRATVTARTTMRLLVAGRGSRDALRSHPAVLRQIAMCLAARLRQAQDPAPLGRTSTVVGCRAAR